jgi:hypothetical protein
MGKGGMMARGVGKYQATGGGAAVSGAASRLRSGSIAVGSASYGARDVGPDELDQGAQGADDGPELAFIARQTPLTPGTAGGLFVFVIFLISFTGLTMLERNDGVFFFAEHTRQLVGIDDFRRLEGQHHTYREYQQWFQYHFVDGLANVSTRLNRFPGSSVAMIGPPRVRQIRYDPSGVNLLPGGGLVNHVYADNLEDDAPFGRGVPDTGGESPGSPVWSSGGQWHHQPADVTGDWAQSGRLNLLYSGGGYVLDLEPWLKRDSDELNPGSEFYPFAHWQINTTDLWEMGWIDKQTKAIIHDFTLYSAATDLFAFCRVTAEFEGNGAVFQMAVNLRVFWLERPNWFMAIQYTFLGFLAILMLGEVQELVEGMKMTEKVLVERTVELKYTLRLKQLQFAAEHGVPELYQPHKVLKKLAYRLYEADSSCVHHIQQLNRIGKAIPPLQAHFDEAMQMLHVSGMKGSGKVFKPNPVVSRRLEKARAELATIRSDEPNVMVICKTFWLRLRCSYEFYFQGEWNTLDSVNYSLLAFSFVLRMWSWSLMPEMREKVASLDRQEPYALAGYINTFWVSSTFQFSFYINAFSSILTWLKLFKFLSFFPEMSIFTKTVTLSAQHLGVFFFVVLIVIIGSAQGFCLAFGADIAGFRDPFQASISVALYTVGKFNYDELVWSQRWFGPLLFWVYIFIVFFVLMSVFIAILSEGYEAAKAVIPATASGNIWEAIQTVAVNNYRDSKQRASMSYKKVTGRNKVHDRWASAGGKVRVGVKLTGAMQAAAMPALEETESAVKKKRAYTIADANIATDSESDGEGVDADTAYQNFMKQKNAKGTLSSKLLTIGGGSLANLRKEDSDDSESGVRRRPGKAIILTTDSYETAKDDDDDDDDDEKEEEEHAETAADAGEDADAADDGSGAAVSAEALQRLQALEDQMESLSTQRSSTSETMAELSKQMQEMGDEQAATLSNILSSLESVAASAAAAGSRDTAQEAGAASARSASGSRGQDHHHHHGHLHSHRGHRHSTPPPAEAEDGRSASNSSRGRRRGASATDTTSSRMISPVRKSVPNMRQQMAAAAAAANATAVLQRKPKKVMSMREQMAASVERSRQQEASGGGRSASSSSPPPAVRAASTGEKKIKPMSMREQMAASAERSRSRSPAAVPPQPVARTSPPKKVMSMRQQMEAAAAAAAASPSSAVAAAPAPAPPKKKLMGLRAQMEAMAAQQGPEGP